MDNVDAVLAQGDAFLKLLDQRGTARKSGFSYTLKEAPDGTVTITGLASSGSIDRMGDIVEPGGMVASLPVPFLLSHDHGNPLGQVTDAKVTSTGIVIKAKAYRGVSDRIDEALRMIGLGLYPGLSIGFRSLKSEPMSGKSKGGWRFTSWELLEVSAVAVPANPDARITAAKQFKPQQVTAPDGGGKIVKIWL